MESIDSPSAPHLSTIQPAWENLQIACEILALRDPELEWRETPPLSNIGDNKISEILTFFRKHLDVIDRHNELTKRGEELLNSFQPTTALGDDEIGRSELQLSKESQELLWDWIWEAHRVPMLAAIHQVKSQRTLNTQTPHRAYSHYVRIEHLNAYRTIAATSHRFRAKVHFHWLKQLGIIMVQNRILRLDDTGRSIYEQYMGQYPKGWKRAEKRASQLVNENENHSTQSRIDQY